MSKEMKYEAVFGNQDLFDGASKDAVIAIKRPFINGVGSEEMYFFSSTFDAVMKAGSSFNFNNVILKTNEYAERSIIQEPKRWTVEDQKAGQLPEVGAEVQFNFYQSAVMRQGVIKYIDDQVAVIQTEDVTRPFCYETCKVVFTPLETPEELAQRLRNEWINEAINAVRKTDVNGYESIYDALLSGALPAPTKGGE